jgi:tetratricopeptide (TPR) repeat protein
MTQMNAKDWEMLGFQVWVFANTLLNQAPLKSFRVAENRETDRKAAHDIIWDCPRCGHENQYLGVVLPPDAGRSLRLCCRNCFTRWDVENKAYQALISPNSLSRKSFGRLTVALFKKIKQRKFREIAAKFLEVFLRIIPLEQLFKSHGAALAADPYNPEKHNDFGDALIKIGAFGAALLHYQQALSLNPENGRALAGITFIADSGISDERRSTYFVSWSVLHT